MNDMWKSIPDVIASIDTPYKLIAFFALCIVLLVINKIKNPKTILTIIRYFFWLIIGSIIVIWTIDFLKNTKEKPQSTDSDYILKEEFESNDNKWNIGNRNRTESMIENGLMTFSSNYNAWYPISISLEKLQNNYENIEITTKFKIDALQENGYGGFDWDMDNHQNRICLYINSKSEIFLGLKVSGKDVMPLLNWKKNLNLKNNEFNEFRIKNINEKTEFYINNAFISDIPLLNFMGNRIGFSSNNSIITVDYVIVNSLK